MMWLHDPPDFPRKEAPTKIQYDPAVRMTDSSVGPNMKSKKQNSSVKYK